LLAMLLDWKNIDRSCLPSQRVFDAPKNVFDDLLAGDKNSNGPKHLDFKAQCTFKKESLWSRIKNFIKGHLGFCADGHSLTSLQESIIIADLHYREAKSKGFKGDVFASKNSVDNLLKKVKNERHMLAHFKSINRVK
jgi:hypothetical protein